MMMLKFCYVFLDLDVEALELIHNLPSKLPHILLINIALQAEEDQVPVGALPEKARPVCLRRRLPQVCQLLGRPGLPPGTQFNCPVEHSSLDSGAAGHPVKPDPGIKDDSAVILTCAPVLQPALPRLRPGHRLVQVANLAGNEGALPVGSE